MQSNERPPTTHSKEPREGYASSLDRDAACALWDLRGTRMSEREWSAHLADMNEITTLRRRTGLRPAVMLFIPNQWVNIEADERARLAAAAGHAAYDPYLAIVTRNIAARGVLRVVTWLNENPRYEAQVFATAAEGLAWLEAKRGAPITPLRGWLRERG